jgi:outer membrane protein assembly factor BamB
MADDGSRTTRRQFLAACGGAPLGVTPLGGCATSLGLPTESAEWATVQRDPGHTGYDPDGEVPQRGLVVGWDFETAYDELLYHPPTFTDGTLLTASEATLYALDAEEGNVRWKHSRTTTNADGESVPFYVGEVVCGANCAFVSWTIPGENDRLTAHNAKTGERKWELEANTTLGAVLPVGNTLYVVATVPEGQQLLALDPGTGEERWRHSVDVASHPPLAYADGTLFSGEFRDEKESFTGWWHIRAFDASDGSRQWSHRVEGSQVGARTDIERFFGIGGGGRPNLTVADGRVYFGTGPYEFYALDAADGSELWTHSMEVGRTDTGHAPVVDEDTVYLANLSNVTALDAETGEQRWQYDDARISFEGYPEWYPILVGDVLLVPEQVTWLALDASTGEEVYRHGHYADGLVGTAPLVVNGVLYVAIGDSMYAIGESW